MLIGSFGAWVKLGAMSVSGTDGSNDGWVVVIAAVLGLLLLVLSRRHRVAGLWALLAGLAGAATTVYDRNNVQDKIHQGGALVQALASVGWGLNVAMIASFSLLIAGIAWLIQITDEEPIGIAPASQRQGDASPLFRRDPTTGEFVEIERGSMQQKDTPTANPDSV
jgi:hypothetical protein